MKSLDKYKGCLVGGAVGDALGYAVEFSSSDAIFDKYGEKGITQYQLVDGVAQISDDTQMTLFTANGLLMGTTRGMLRGIMGPYPIYIKKCYEEWLHTQDGEFPLKACNQYTWLANVPQLFSSRAPGITCINALRSKEEGTVKKPLNDSKGCGGVMRVAPIGLYFDNDRIPQKEIDMIGAETAAITHGHELGYIPAAGLVHIISLISHSEDITLLEAVNDMKEAISKQFAKASHLPEMISLIDKAIELSTKNMNDLEAIRQLGEGWVAEETLAIAVYCALKYEKDFEKCMIAAVNHSGDSDSTGAVAGNILGAYLGYDAIPKKFIDNLELKNVILEIAEDLFNDCRISEYSMDEDPIWVQKYVYQSYEPK